MTTLNQTAAPKRAWTYISHRRPHNLTGAGDAIGGTIALDSGVETGTLAALGLGSVPLSVALTVQAALGGQVLWASLVGDPSTDGFVWQLSAPTDAATYKLHYQIVL